MKRIFKISILFLAAALLAVGCNKDNFLDNPNSGDNPGVNPGDPTNPEVGYLVLSKMNLSISPDIEILENGQTPTNKIILASDTRATEAADSEYRVTITNKTSLEEVWTGTYGQILAMTEPMPLPPGRYIIAAKSPSEILPVAWEKPEYAGSVEFSIVKKITTPVDNLVCTLSNIKTTVELSADLKKLFKDGGEDPLKTVVSIKETSCEFSRDETRPAFFKAEEPSNTLVITLSGEYNVKGEGEAPVYQHVEMTNEVTNVKAGQWRRIAISIEHADDGNVQFKVTVETWVYDEKINIDVMSPSFTFGEEVIPDEEEEKTDPDSPVLQLDGHDITVPFLISSSIFDEDLNIWSDRISLIATPNGASQVTEAYCVIGSDNADLLAALATAGYADYKIALFPTNAAADYAVIRTDANHRLLIKLNDAAMSGLYAYAGNHTVKIMVKDNQNRRSFTTLAIQVIKGAGSGPTVTALNGFDFLKRYTISVSDDPSLKVALEVSSTTGITGFIVEINGGVVLPDNELIGLDLAPRMDLVNPASPEMKSRLKELGFIPADGTIAGKTKMTFDISEFIPAMCVLPGKGNCDFKLIVTDASGTIEKNLMFTTVQ